MSRLRRRIYPKHSGDPFDRFISERSKGADGEFSFAQMVALFEAMGRSEFIPREGNNGTKRMTAGILLRSACADGVITFADGTRVILNLDEEFQ